MKGSLKLNLKDCCFSYYRQGGQCVSYPSAPQRRNESSQKGLHHAHYNKQTYAHIVLLILPMGALVRIQANTRPYAQAYNLYDLAPIQYSHGGETFRNAFHTIRGPLCLHRYHNLQLNI